MPNILHRRGTLYGFHNILQQLEQLRVLCIGGKDEELASIFAISLDVAQRWFLYKQKEESGYVGIWMTCLSNGRKILPEV